MPVRSFAADVSAVSVCAEVADSVSAGTLSVSAEVLSAADAGTLADTDTLSDAPEASKTWAEAATLEASVELQAAKLSAELGTSIVEKRFF